MTEDRSRQAPGIPAGIAPGKASGARAQRRPLFRRWAALSGPAVLIVALSAPAHPQSAPDQQPRSGSQAAAGPRATPRPAAPGQQAQLGPRANAEQTLPAEQKLPTIPMPADVTVVAPGADVPASVARFAGAWAHGAWDSVVPHVLIVETVEASGRAQVIYALGDFAEGTVARGYRRVTGQILGDFLAVPLGEGTSAEYHREADTLRGAYVSPRRRYTVTLRRATLAEATSTAASVPGVVTASTVRIPVTEAGATGKRVTLEAALYRPAGRGPHPVLLFNHGSTGGGTVAASVTLRPTRQAPFFIERGFAVLAPMRRGRGASDGVADEHEGTCDPQILGPGFARGIDDVDAAMAYVRAQPWADAGRVVIAGQSRGGILSVAYAAERPGAVRAVINFAGGWTRDGCDEGGRGFNQATFSAAGARIRVPTLWLYAEQDRYYSTSWIRRYQLGFAQAGGDTTLHVFPAFGGEGHRLVDRVEIWRSAADEFLRRLNLTSP